MGAPAGDSAFFRAAAADGDGDTTASGTLMAVAGAKLGAKVGATTAGVEGGGADDSACLSHPPKAGTRARISALVCRPDLAMGLPRPKRGTTPRRSRAMTQEVTAQRGTSLCCCVPTKRS
jgi:hypothetical protein